MKQPPGLFLLFGVEMWERFSFYGMKAMLVLFLTDVARGGFGWSKPAADRLFGLYGFCVYALPLGGGYLADRLIGTRRSMVIGGLIIAAGHFCLALPSTVDVLPGPGAGRDRHRLLQAQRFDDGRPALRRERPAARRWLHDLLHGRQRRRSLRPAGLWLPGREPALGLALRLRRRRRRHGVRHRDVPGVARAATCRASACRRHAVRRRARRRPPRRRARGSRAWSATACSRCW